ncbi:MAG: T9SS type A sorting domain-containing protein [Bacteroidetes bacterium]|jgi:photosystem II stability/assembly factor-like uncharacterized protein|nr:T9SS type A sorting domain-containing protein [Bacteroidota bacterium]
MKKTVILFVFVFSTTVLLGQWILKVDLAAEYPPLTNRSSIICFTSGQNAYFTTEGSGIHMAYYTIHRTSDAWHSWPQVYGEGTNYFRRNISDIAFVNDTIGYRLSGDGLWAWVYKTVNGGLTWTSVPNNTHLHSFSRMSYPSVDLGYFFRLKSSSGQFLAIKSDNGSCTITDFPDNYIHPDYINFINDSTGFIFCSDTLQNYNCFKTSDYGANWDNVLSDSLSRFTELHFPSQQVGYMSAMNGLVYKTNDGGETWSKLSTPNNIAKNGVYFLNENCGFVAGDSGLLMRTIDGGQNWTIDSTFTKESIKKVYFADSLTGYFATSKNKIFKTGFVGIPENILTEEKPESIILFPNPADNYISLKNSQSLQRASIKVFSNQGKEVSTRVNWVSDSKLDISKLASGLYFLQISTTNKVLTGRFIKK